MENIFIELSMAVWHLVQPVLAALTPLFIGLFLAWLLYPAVHWLAPRIGAGWAIAATYAGLFASIAAVTGGFAVLISGALPIGSLTETAALISSYFLDTAQSLSDFSAKYLPGLFPDARAAEAGIQNWISRNISFNAIASAVTALSGAAFSIVLGIVVSIYLLKDRSYFLLLWNQLLSLVLPQKRHGQLCELISEISSVVYAFLKGALIDSILIALLSSAALTILNIKFAVAIGVLGGLFNVIPYFGPILGMIPAFLVSFFQDGLAKAAASVFLLFLIQQLDSNFIYPKIVGSSTGLHPLFILLSVSISGYFFGLAGMLMAVPTAGILQILIRRWAYR